MGNWLNVNLFLAWCCLQTLAEIVEHHPVLEGSSTTLVCSGNSSRKRSVYWRKIFPDKPYKRIATCHDFNQQTCEVKNQEYNVQHTSTDISFNSSLSWPVSVEDRNITINCSVYDYTDNPSRFIHSWIFSMNYHPAENVVCRAVQADVYNVSVDCSVERIYPGFICEMSEIYENMNSTVDKKEIKYNQTRVDSRGYISALCYVVRQVTCKGIYRYRVKVYPDKTLANVETAVREIETEPVEMLLEPKGVLEQERCHGDNAALIFKCTAYWFLAMPSFHWSLDEENIHKTNSSVISSNGHVQYVSKAELPGNTSQNGRQIQCRIETGSHIFFNETKTIRHIWPTPQRPYFINDGKSILRGLFTLPEPKQSDMFTCKPNGNTDKMTLISVTCKTSSQNLLDMFGHDASLSFNINYSAADSNIHCKCSVQYTTACVLSNQLNIILKPGSHSQSLGTTKTTMIIIAAFVLLILFVCMIATILFLRNRWSELYIYVYNRSSASKGLNPGFTDNGVYSYGSGAANDKLSAVSYSHSQSGKDNEGEEAMPINMLPNVSNHTQRLSEYSDSDCGDIECLPPVIPPRGHLASDTIIPVSDSRLTSQRTTPECYSLYSSSEGSISHPRPESWYSGHESEPCNLSLTDDGYMKPVELPHRSHHFKRNTSRRNNEQSIPQPCLSEDATTAGYLHIVPDLPPREPLLAGTLRKSSRSLRHTAEFLQSSPPLPPRKPTVKTTSGTAPGLGYSNISRRMN